MKESFDYTGRARHFASRYPLLSFIVTQVNFWVLSSCFYGIIMYLQIKSFKAAYGIPAQDNVGRILSVAAILGISYGIMLGIADYFLDRRFFRNKSLGFIIILKTLISAAVMLLFYLLLRYVLFANLVMSVRVNDAVPPSAASWRYFFYIYCFYNFFMIILITFINQINRKFGPGVLIPLLLGKYRKPHAEERVFMFMDLKSSTTIAENIGHMHYSEFISDAFMDINHVLPKYSAEIYQYVGDEIVLSWKVNSKLNYNECIAFYYATQKEFQRRKNHYLKKYKKVPVFKVGLHCGVVSAVEIGDIKRDIAYHGDVLNTTARIQSLCNEHQKMILASEDFIARCKFNNGLISYPVGNIILRGKSLPVNVYCVEKK